MKSQPPYHINQDTFEQYKKAYQEILPERHYQIIYERFMKQKSYREIGKLFDVTPERIRQIVGKACYELHKKRYPMQGRESFEQRKKAPYQRCLFVRVQKLNASFKRACRSQYRTSRFSVFVQPWDWSHYWEGLIIAGV